MFGTYLMAGAMAAAMVVSSAPAMAAGLKVSVVPSAVAQRQVQPTRTLDPATRVHLTVVLPIRNKERLRDLLTVLYTPSSPLYRHWLTVAQFTKQFGPTQKDYDAAMRFFRTQGL